MSVWTQALVCVRDVLKEDYYFLLHWHEILVV